MPEKRIPVRIKIKRISFPTTMRVWVYCMVGLEPIRTIRRRGAVVKARPLQRSVSVELAAGRSARIVDVQGILDDLLRQLSVSDRTAAMRVYRDRSNHERSVTAQLLDDAIRRNTPLRKKRRLPFSPRLILRWTGAPAQVCRDVQWDLEEGFSEYANAHGERSARMWYLVEVLGTWVYLARRSWSNS